MRYLTFVEKKENVYQVKNKQGIHLGWISYYPKWNRYVYSTHGAEFVIHDVICMKEIISFIKVLEGNG